MTRMVLFLAVAAPTLNAYAAQTPSAVAAAIEQLNPGVRIIEPRSSPVSGLYHTTLDGTSGYVTADGRYFIVGDMYDVKSRRNLSEENRKAARVEVLREIDDATAIVFAPPAPKHTITVFTDVDCGYCRKLHSEIVQYNELGIAVRYVAYPRSGPNTESWTTMESVWCAKDRRDALTRAKRGERIERSAVCAAPVAAHYLFGERAGVQGTPLILLNDGSAVNGYLSPQQLGQRLDSGRATRAASVQP